jgi:OmpA-OmpF porin, OOP family
MKKTLICGALLASLASAQAFADPVSGNDLFAPGVGRQAESLMSTAQRITDPYQRGLAEGWLEIADRQDSHVLVSSVYNDAAARALNNGRHFIDGSVPFQPIYGQKNWPPEQTRGKWVQALQEIERTNERAANSPCRGEDAGRLSALTDEAWKEQDETHATHWVHGWEAIERAQKLAQKVNGDLDKCVPPPIAVPVEAPVLAKPVSLAADALFDFDSAKLKPEGERMVAVVAQQIRDSHAKVNVLRVDGYTDRFGSVAHNKKLSLQRAQTVVKALQDQGVVADRFDVVGRGSADAVKFCPGSKATADVVACLAPNRRVQISAN